ncbi:MAG: hypothetical protein RQ761_04475 [Bacteroidales bacterium]|nr:hypothetical protein [Bacteroidales bacterium]
MILNLLKHGLRSLKKQKAFVFINMIGLSIGLECAIIIALFIRHELSFDTYHEKKDRIYQLVLHGRLGDDETYYKYLWIFGSIAIFTGIPSPHCHCLV